jgi:MerR family Zn(II)-responsive transcriptional regulator of zntA
MLQVGEVSRRLGLNPQTLYFYERIGLIPAAKRTQAGYRLFDEQDIERLSFITRVKALGFSLEEIKELLKLQDQCFFSCGEVYNILFYKIQQIEQNIRQLQDLREELLPLLERCQENSTHAEPDRQCVVFRESISEDS